MSRKYASGAKAWGICGRSGQRMLLKDMIFDGRFPAMRVHPSWWEPKDPLEYAPKLEDPIALWRPAPEDYPIVAPILDAVPDETGVILTWTASSSPVMNIDGYRLYRMVVEEGEQEGEFELVEDFPVVRDSYGTLVSQTLTYLDEDDYEGGTVVHYYVVAYSTRAEGSRTARSNTEEVEFEVNPEESIVLTAAQPIASGPIHVAWNPSFPLADATGYDLYRRINGGAYVLLREFIRTDLTGVVAAQSISNGVPLTLKPIASALDPARELLLSVSPAPAEGAILFQIEYLDQFGIPVSALMDAYGFDGSGNTFGPASSITSITPTSNNPGTVVVGWVEQIDFDAPAFDDYGGDYRISLGTVSGVLSAANNSGVQSLLHPLDPMIGSLRPPSFDATGTFGAIDNRAIGGDFTLEGMYDWEDVSAVLTEGLEIVVRGTIPLTSTNYIDGTITINGVTLHYSEAVQQTPGTIGVLSSHMFRYWHLANLLAGQDYPFDLEIGYYNYFQNGDAIDYYVDAHRDAVADLQSNVDGVIFAVNTLTAPVLTAQFIASGIPIHLSWTAAVPSDPGDPVVTYDIFRSINGADFEYVDSVAGNVFSFDDSDSYSDNDEITYYVQAGTTYIAAFSNEETITYQILPGIVADGDFVEPNYLGYSSSFLLTEGAGWGSRVVPDEIFPGYNLYFACDTYDGSGVAVPGFLLIMRKVDNSAPDVDAFTTVTINGVTYDTGDCADVGSRDNLTYGAPQTALDTADLNYQNSRFWFWPGQAGLVSGNFYQLEFA